MRVMSFDPGKTTGVSLLEEGCRGNFVTAKCLMSDALHDANPLKVATWFDQYLTNHTLWMPDYVVIEQYVGGAGGSMQSLTNQIIGVIMGVAVAHRIPLVMQNNVMRKPYLKRAQAKSISNSNHARDAVAHGLAFIHRGQR